MFIWLKQIKILCALEKSNKISAAVFKNHLKKSHFTRKKSNVPKWTKWFKIFGAKIQIVFENETFLTQFKLTLIGWWLETWELGEIPLVIPLLEEGAPSASSTKRLSGIVEYTRETVPLGSTRKTKAQSTSSGNSPACNQIRTLWLVTQSVQKCFFKAIFMVQ